MTEAQPLHSSFSHSWCCFIFFQQNLSSQLSPEWRPLHFTFCSGNGNQIIFWFQTLLQCFLLSHTAAHSSQFCSLQESFHLAFCALCRNHPPPSSPVTSNSNPHSLQLKITTRCGGSGQRKPEWKKIIAFSHWMAHVKLYILNNK